MNWKPSVSHLPLRKLHRLVFSYYKTTSEWSVLLRIHSDLFMALHQANVAPHFPVHFPVTLLCAKIPALEGREEWGCCSRAFPFKQLAWNRNPNKQKRHLANLVFVLVCHQLYLELESLVITPFAVQSKEGFSVTLALLQVTSLLCIFFKKAMDPCSSSL